MKVTEIKPSKEQWDSVYSIIEKEILRITREQQSNKKNA